MRPAVLLALLLGGCSTLLPHRPAPAVTYADAFVSVPPAVVRPALRRLALPFPTVIDGDGGAFPAGDAVGYRVSTAEAVGPDSVGTVVRVARRALPNTSAPAPTEVLSRLTDLGWEQPVTVLYAPIWSDARSRAAGLCPPPGDGLFDPDEEADAFDYAPSIYGGMDALADKTVYPRPMRDAGVEGRVWLRFAVEADGSVGCLQVLESPSEGLSEAAARAVRAVRFRAAERLGVPVRFWMLDSINFVLR